MIYVVCGLIGAGKSSYSSQNFQIVSDAEEKISKKTPKTDQILDTKRIYESGGDVAHVTCYPTPEEMEFFRTVPPEEISFLWIDTDEAQARRNILQRNRARDMRNLSETLAKNHDLMHKFYQSSIPFKLVTLFDDGEKW